MKRVLTTLMVLTVVTITGFGVVMGPRWPWFVTQGGEASAYSTDPNVANLVFHWDYETTNTVATLDTVVTYPATNMPTVETGPTWTIIGTNTEARVEMGYSFDFSDDYFKMGPEVISGETGTFCAWINPNSWDFWPNIFSSASEADGNYLIQFTLGSFGELQVYSLAGEGTGNGVDTTSALSLNTWSHVAVSTDGSEWTLWINGVTQSVTVITANSGRWGADIDNRDNSVLGAMDWVWGTSYYFGGLMDDARMYNVGLTNLDWIIANTHPTNNLEARP